VLGGSYGGYMTSWLTARHGGRWKAACSERAVNDVVLLERSSDIAGAFRTWTGVSHVEKPEPLAERSPLTYVRDLDVPMLIVHSEGDRRCPVDQADALFVALRLLGRTVEYLRFPAESHELSRSGSPKHRVARAEAILEWFACWLPD
jgi:dipeptidyl aminopeptidase/acylaminoacyl peptidase